MVCAVLPSRYGVQVVHGPTEDTFDGLVGASIFAIRVALADAFNLPQYALACVNGERVSSMHLVRDGDRVDFVVPWGRKGADEPPLPESNRLFTVKEAAAELRCSISFIYKLMLTGQIAYERRGRRKLPIATSVADYRRRNTHPAAPALPPSPVKSARQPYQFQRLFTDRRPRTAH